VNGLSVATPYCTASLDFDVIFRGDPFSLRMLISKDASRRLLPHYRRRLGRSGRIHGTRYRMFGEPPGAAPLETAEDDVAFAPAMLAAYSHVLRQMEQRLFAAFGPSRTIFSETSHLPLRAIQA
jgi:hypothetical protein